MMSTDTSERTEGGTSSPADRSDGPPSGASRFQAWTHSASDRRRILLEPAWNDRRVAVAVAIVVPALWGLGAGWWMPRGPLTSADAIWSIVFSLVVGAISGIALRSRWTLLLAPVVFAVLFELARIGIDGPTVDGVHTSMYGTLAFGVGRGFHALVSLLPIAFGAIIGAGLARHLDPPHDHERGHRGWLYVRRATAIVAAVGLVAFTALLAQPASSDAIIDADGQPVPGSIAELTTVDINGHDLAMMIRGHSIDNPVLLFLAGGPGGSELGSMRNHLPGLEEHFTVVTWDQRGAGKSYSELDPTETITLDGYIDDTIDVTNYLRERLGQDEIYVLGQSWGTTLGVFAVQQHPELYRAFIGTGQMVSQLATDTTFYRDTLEWATANDNSDLVNELEAIGPPPYDEMLNYETALAHEQDVYPYDHTPNDEGQGQMSENLIADEYTLVDEVHILGAFMDTFAALYPQLQDIDFRATATEFEVPMFFVQGAHEADGRADVFAEWYPMIDAPITDLAVLDTSGHRPLFEQPDQFVDYVVDTVLARTTDAD